MEISLINILGSVGSLCFAFCLAPQVVKVYKEKSFEGCSFLFVLLSILGNICSFAYVLAINLQTNVFQFPLYFNYFVALILCALLVVAKFRFKNSKSKKFDFKIHHFPDEPIVTPEDRNYVVVLLLCQGCEKTIPYNISERRRILSRYDLECVREKGPDDIGLSDEFDYVYERDLMKFFGCDV